MERFFIRWSQARDVNNRQAAGQECKSALGQRGLIQRLLPHQALIVNVADCGYPQHGGQARPMTLTMQAEIIRGGGSGYVCNKNEHRAVTMTVNIERDNS